MEKIKILITGGAGFVGSHLCEQLAKDKKNEIYSLDNYSMGSTANHIQNVTYIKGETSHINEVIDFSPNILYHLGEYSRVEQSFDDIHTVWKSNKNGIFSVLEFVRKVGCKIVYAGSSTKFGDSGSARNTSPYAWTKATNTELVINYGKWFKIPYAITYFYNVYGKREIEDGKYATLIALWINKMKNNEDLEIVSPGHQERNFTHVNDIINGLILVGEHGTGDEFGIGSPESFSIIELAKIFGGNIKMIDERKGNRMSADLVDKKTRSLGWSPKHKLEDYIEELRSNQWKHK